MNDQYPNPMNDDQLGFHNGEIDYGMEVEIPPFDELPTFTMAPAGEYVLEVNKVTVVPSKEMKRPRIDMSVSIVSDDATANYFSFVYMMSLPLKVGTLYMKGNGEQMQYTNKDAQRDLDTLRSVLEATRVTYTNGNQIDWADMAGRRFVGKVGIENQPGYAPRNRLIGFVSPA